MKEKPFRSIFQIAFMVSVVAIAAITGWACGCDYGSDHTGGSKESSFLAGEGLLVRYHDVELDNVTLNDKDVAYLRDWLENGDISIGLLVPQAPGAIEPGSISTDTHNVWLNYQPATGSPKYVLVPLVSDPAKAQQLETLFPSASDEQWQALMPENYDWMADVPTQTITIEHLFGSLMYHIDFHGSEVCDHCQMQLTACTNRQFSFSETALLKIIGLDNYTSNEELTCATPIASTVLVTEWPTGTLPGPVALSFGFWGGSVYEPITTTTVTIPYALLHTASVTRTVVLDPIQSGNGWSYHWEDMSGNPITQLEIGPIGDPFYLYLDIPTVQLVGEGLPTCVRRLDPVQISASLAMTPTITAETSISVQSLPDPALCNVADVGILQIASDNSLTAGEVVTFTWTITNFESAPVSVVVTATLSSASAVGNLTLPAECTRSGAEIYCAIANLPGGGTDTLQVQVQTTTVFNGVLASLVRVEPVGAIDARFYDNASGPLGIDITGGTGMLTIYLPLIRR